MADGVEQAIRIAPPADEADRAWLAELWRSEWGGETMVTRGRLYRLADLDALLAWEGTARVGAATFRLADDGCELTSLNPRAPGRGNWHGAAGRRRSRRPCRRVPPALADHHQRQRRRAALLPAARLSPGGRAPWGRRRGAATETDCSARRRPRHPHPRRARTGEAVVVSADFSGSVPAAPGRSTRSITATRGGT